MRIFLAALLLVACGASETNRDAGVPADAAAVGLCPIKDSCIPCGAEGNERKVGEYCTKGGGECDDNGFGGNAILCAMDYRDDAPPMCTRACQVDADCGSNAVCRADPTDPTNKACVPNACLGDAGALDGG